MITGITEYGLAIKGKIVQLNQTQDWLVSQVRERTGLYFDTSYLHKVMTGRLKSKKILTAINEILELKEEE